MFSNTMLRPSSNVKYNQYRFVTLVVLQVQLAKRGQPLLLQKMLALFKIIKKALLLKILK